LAPDQERIVNDLVTPEPRATSARPPYKVAITLEINGSEMQLEVEPWTTLLDLLRERLDMTGTKKGCDHGQCGACTVLVNGKRNIVMPDARGHGGWRRDHHH
jgi:xanthine dehydrogenase YagT iron-sulfur-binding subunit